MSDNIYIEIKNETCIICLEKMDLDEDYLTTVCVKCDVKAHVSCLNEWYQKKNKKLCPICLKTEKYYLKKLINTNNNNFIENDEEHSILNNQNNNLDSDNEDLNENSDDEINNDIDAENTNEYIINNYYRLNTNNSHIRFRCVLICAIIVFMFIITYILNLYN